jgi:hypothetical protein
MSRWDGHLIKLIDEARAGRENDDCWPWPGNINITHGYGRYGQDMAHRVVYRFLVGPIPDGMTVDHECHNRDVACRKLADACQHRRCINPRHLTLKPIGDNGRAARRPRDTCGKCGRKYDWISRTKRDGIVRRCSHCTLAANHRSWARHRE